MPGMIGGRCEVCGGKHEVGSFCWVMVLAALLILGIPIVIAVLQ